MMKLHELHREYVWLQVVPCCGDCVSVMQHQPARIRLQLQFDPLSSVHNWKLPPMTLTWLYIPARIRASVYVWRTFSQTRWTMSSACSRTTGK
ncbi:hypothetical protein DPMN_057050 [Dreissena polymorpha]|uniref:Uncharacterized protein n=1 Tax=Dreissena polymorpha TaxID=45954 RepID=A0A9D4CVR6_DREPO|nr:hypothetical protein DPMN_057050 [Dreissena polymorpha]